MGQVRTLRHGTGPCNMRTLESGAFSRFDANRPCQCLINDAFRANGAIGRGSSLQQRATLPGFALIPQLPSLRVVRPATTSCCGSRPAGFELWRSEQPPVLGGKELKNQAHLFSAYACP